jgi:hypothetical protein
MKKLMFVFSTMLILTTATFAQNASAPATPAAPAKAKEMKQKGKEMGHEKGKEMSEKGRASGMGMGLTPEQETQFKTINEGHKAAVKKVEMDKTLSADAKKTQIDALKSTYEANVQGVMNAEQFTKWKAMRAKRSENKGDHGKMEDHKGKMEDHKGKMEDHKGKMEDHKEKMGDKKGKAKSDKAVPQGAAKSN